MKKKFLLTLLALVCALCCAFSLAACGENPDNSGGGENNEITQPIAVESVTLNKDELTLTKGNEETLTATVKPDDATNKTVTWTSSNPAVATVNENGKVVAVAQGTAVISATAGNKSADCTVKVNAPTPSEFENKTYVFDRFESEDLDTEMIELVTSSWRGNYIAFGAGYSVTVNGGFVCGDNAVYEQVGNEIRLYTYPDEYPSAYQTLIYDNGELVLQVTVSGSIGRYIYVLQTSD